MAKTHGSDRGRKGVAGGLVLLLTAAVVPGCVGQSGEGSARDERPDAPSQSTRPTVRTGVDVLLSDSIHLVQGARVGLVSNHTGVTGGGLSTAVALQRRPEVELVALFGPEHGFPGATEAGERVASGTDSATGLPVYSLYTDTRRPLPHMLEGLDVLLFDMQDVGARYYTYVSTMALAMRSAGEAGIRFVVLDRPNPIGARTQGNVLDPAFASFVGLYPVPMRHGMTPAELALLYAGEFGIEVDLSVVPVRDHTRDTWYDETGLEWIPPSPNMPSLESAAHYPGTCLFEGTNFSVGRGTARPFQWVGAPWIDGAAFAEALRAYDLPGVRIDPVRYTPVEPGDGKWDGTEVGGVRLTVLDRDSYDPTTTAVALLLEARRLSGDRWAWREAHFDSLAGTDRLRSAIESGRRWADIVAAWRAPLDNFEALREPYLLYR